MIVKDEEDNLPVILESIKGIWDELVIIDTGSTDNTKKIAKKFGATIHDLKLEPFSFAEARNFSFSKCTGDWILWVDADDVLVRPENVRKQMDEADPLTTCYLALYNYAFDQKGHCVSRHWKERLVKNDGTYTWAGPLHEALVPLRETNARHTDFFEVTHAKGVEGFERSSQRNYEIISKFVDKEGQDKTDPRNLLSLANACLGLGKYEDAIKLFLSFTKRSGWAEEIYVAFHRAAICSRMLGKFQEALSFEFEALKIDPKIKDAYIGLGQTFMELKDWTRAEHWLLSSFAHINQKQATIHNPFEYEFSPWWLLAHTYSEMAAEGEGIRNIDKALECFSKCEDILKSDTDTKTRIELLQGIKAQEILADASLRVGSAIKEENETNFEKFLTLIPKKIADFPTVWKMRTSRKPIEKSTGRDIAIFCGNCFEPWTPEYLKTGVGGSEEAVIHLSRLLVKRGWNVTVYNTVDKTQEFDGVKYQPFWSFNQHDAIDIFIGWRQPALWEVFTPNTKKNYLWIHDAIQDSEFSLKRLAKIDKVMLLSKFHRSLFPSIPEEKVMYTANGLWWPDMEVKEPKQPWKMINTSAPDRGIECLLKMWPRIKSRYPEAELYWYYGWQSFDAAFSENPERMAWKQSIKDLFQQEGTHEGGRIGHNEIAKEMASSDLWVYPTEFREISCISAMKSQALGCIPVCTDVAALKETVQRGIKLPQQDIYTNSTVQEEFISALGKARELDRIEMRENAKQFSWEKVADQWDKEFSEAVTLTGFVYS